MKKEGRTTLICRKKINNGQTEMFNVVVKTSERDNAKKNYENQGYTVSVKKQLTKVNIYGIIHI